MKTALIFFRNPSKNFDGKYYQDVLDLFVSSGFDISTTDVLSADDDISFNRRLDAYRDTVDNLVVIGADEALFDLKNIVATTMDAPLIENENAKTFLDAISKSHGVDYGIENAMLPIDSTVIPNLNGAYQGFIMDDNEFTLCLLPSDYKQVNVMCLKYLLPYLENKYGVESNRITLKYFGDKAPLINALTGAKEIGKFSYTVDFRNGDCTINLTFTDGEKDGEREIVRYLITELKENVYAEFDTTLGQRLFDLLKLKKLKISIAESFTGGRVSAEIIKNSGASEYVNEGIVSYSNQSKMKRLKVEKADLIRHGAVSSVVAYQMAAGLLREGDCDVAIATTGIAGPKSDNTEKPVGLCYIAVGLKNGVHTYRFNLTGDREEITETAKNLALFLAIKRLKNINQ